LIGPQNVTHLDIDIYYLSSNMSDSFDYAKAFPNPPVVRDALLHELKVKPWVEQAHEPFYLTHAIIIDPVKGQLLDGEYVIRVEKGEIASLEPQEGAKLEGDFKQINVKGRFVCPGLIDAHVHVCAVPGVEVSCLRDGRKERCS
jgi:hypothetical protein